MTRNDPVWWASWIAPWVVVLAYAVTVSLLPRPHLPWFHSEHGPVENATALTFLLTAVLGLGVLLALRRMDAPVPEACRIWHLLLVLGALFMFGEETSYGQHWLGWESPAYFQAHNIQSETNLHNLYGNTPSDTLRKVANNGLPLFAFVVPLLTLRLKRTAQGDPNRPLANLFQHAYEPGDWTRYLLPRWEMVTWVALAALITPIRRIAGLDAGYWNGSLSEFKELLWAAALLVYTLGIYRRITAQRGLSDDGLPQVSHA